ncbi:hypothetical protein [Nodosilinea nodulosa]|uniref:hypothetical protein n=1 Tax=Nodosilinea nodulosa TaxID=416001 RepID=UPI000314CF4F|nr:hypothetical protein [Nodosilinea nodulosa]
MQKTLNHYAEVILSPNRVGLFLLAIVAVAGAGHIIVYVLANFFDIRSFPLAGIFHFFNMRDEGNFPTYISALNLLLAGGLCGFIFHHETQLKKYAAWHWLGLCMLLLGMSLDEAARIHDAIIGPLSIYFLGRGEGVLYYKWYLFYLPIVAVVCAVYIPFLKRLTLFFFVAFFHVWGGLFDWGSRHGDGRSFPVFNRSKYN